MIRDNNWGTPSKVFLSKNPLLVGDTNLKPVEEDFKELDIEVHNLDGAINTMVQESVDNARYVADDFNHTISMKITITQKLPRKLKKYVKKTYFDEYPKRMERTMLNFAFAANNPHKARKVGLRVESQKGVSHEH